MKKRFFYEVYSFNGQSPTGTITHKIFEFFGDAQSFLIENLNKDLYVDEWVIYADGSKLSKNLI